MASARAPHPHEKWTGAFPLSIFFLLPLALGLASCTAARRGADGPPARVAGAEATDAVIGVSVEGRPIVCRRLGAGPEVVLILATIHGSEAAGTPLVERLAEVLARTPRLLAGRRVLLVPVANPDGLARGSRLNAHRVDLNRNFPAANFRGGTRHGAAALSEPESRALDGLLAAWRPARVVTIHQPLARVDYDGPAAGLAAAMARAGDLPVERIGGLPGSLGSYVGGTLRIPIITLELRHGDERLSADDLWARYGRMLIAAVCYPEPFPPTQ